MNSAERKSPSAILVDANLLVLFVVGSVNRHRIRTFKRTSKYNEWDFDFLMDLMAKFTTILTSAHVMAEVSNLTALNGEERASARSVLKRVIAQHEEPAMPSRQASENAAYAKLGLTDAAIAEIALEKGCSVLTDDLELWIVLEERGVSAMNFTHLRAQAMDV